MQKYLHVFVKSIVGNFYTIEIEDLETTVSYFKNMLCWLSDVHPENQRLIWAGRQL
jgi:hypothetical protein